MAIKVSFDQDDNLVYTGEVDEYVPPTLDLDKLDEDLAAIDRNEFPDECDDYEDEEWDDPELGAYVRSLCDECGAAPGELHSCEKV